MDVGRTDHEKSIIKIQNGKYIGFGYLDIEQDQFTPDKLDSVINTYKDNKDVQQIIRSHLRRNPVEAIIKFKAKKA